ncbi:MULTISPECIES: ABC transporter ATP-binding protein [unclassified Mesorhizobium]|uniref:ABC transporter ATP-binding protein n=1 Tax=unclassified Mesorhizobium TaxID=325217 RepID=UPI001FE1993B|nr:MULTISPECIES: ABC transporter ATP-binding protein [unclassified Mesorhizobium]MCT2581257.1 ABC transporter ATP-binding protein [Mesorhizobium sp. P13.3]MDF3170348.1 ABC transporter ATP-binding protein [Mesorhizobium sp. P16.1]MDF3181403.1 ABC transporter ATP-binding protein [Mesorhizobium sp. P17.1]MDF3187170.1 ABC transporter ATP-binding protein [Mesorhizobium sp. ICCV3110.1]
MLDETAIGGHPAHAIELKGISKMYGAVPALHRTDLDVKKSEFLTLLGPSGSGKTTLLNLIAGATGPTTGVILLDGRDITRMPPRERGIGMVFQNYALMPHMTVFENVAYPLRARRETGKAIRAKVTEALERVGLRGFENRKPRQLSGGQQQRVGIARCIVYSPAIIMMDEPLGALDKNLREQMQGEIKRLHKDLGTTFIYVTHDQEEALNMSDRICLMNMGEIAQLGTPDELYFQPRSRFVAEFIGESNLVSGRMDGAGRMLIGGNRSIAVPGVIRAKGSELLAMIRPERVRFCGIDEAVADGDNCLSGKVASSSFVGGTTRVTIQCDNGMNIVAKMMSGRSETRPQSGARVNLCWSSADMVVLEN